MKASKIRRIYDKLDSINDPELKSLIYELLSEVNKDALTKVYNRRVLSDNLKYDVIVMCDVDNFKEINDKFGHLMGDKILIEISKKLQTAFRNTDMICRYGGDEFAILIRNSNINNVLKRIEIIQKEFSEFEFESNLRVTLSFGLSEYEFGKGFRETLKEADEALYISKRKGKDTITVYSAKDATNKKLVH